MEYIKLHLSHLSQTNGSGSWRALVGVASLERCMYLLNIDSLSARDTGKLVIRFQSGCSGQMKEADAPPSTGSSIPVMKEDSSLAK